MGVQDEDIEIHKKLVIHLNVIMYKVINVISTNIITVLNRRY